MSVFSLPYVIDINSMNPSLSPLKLVLPVTSPKDITSPNIKLKGQVMTIASPNFKQKGLAMTTNSPSLKPNGPVMTTSPNLSPTTDTTSPNIKLKGMAIRVVEFSNVVYKIFA